MKKKILIFSGIVFNISSITLGLIAIFLPWYVISIKGDIDNQKYDTKVTFHLTKYTCYYLDNDNVTISQKTNNYGTSFGGNECYPILPPTAGLFTLGIALMVSLVFLLISLIPTIISTTLQFLMLQSKSRFRVMWVKILIMILSIITCIFYFLVFIFNSSINKNLQSYSNDDQTSTSSDEFTKSLGDSLWCNSFYGSSDYSPLVQNLNSTWKPAYSFYFSVSSSILTLLSSILTCFLYTPKHKNNKYIKIDHNTQILNHSQYCQKYQPHNIQQNNYTNYQNYLK